MERDGGSENDDSSPDTVLARSSSDDLEDRQTNLGSTSGEYVTVAGSSSSLDASSTAAVVVAAVTTVTDVVGTITTTTTTTTTTTVPSVTEEKKKKRFAILKNSFSKDGGIFRTKKKNRIATVEDLPVGSIIEARAAEDPDRKEKERSSCSKLDRQQQEQQRREDEQQREASTTIGAKKKKKKKSQSLVRKFSFNKFRLSSSLPSSATTTTTEQQHEREARRAAPEGGDSSRSQSQSSQESGASHSDSPSKLSRKGCDREKVAGGEVRGEREKAGGRGQQQLQQVSKDIEKKPIERQQQQIERPISSVVVVQRRSPSLTIRSFPKNPDDEIPITQRQQRTTCTSTLPYAISKWADRSSDPDVTKKTTRLASKADSESALTAKREYAAAASSSSSSSSPLELRRKLSLLEEKRAIFQRRPIDSSQDTDSGETVIAVSLDEDNDNRDSTSTAVTATSIAAAAAAATTTQTNDPLRETRRKARHISVRKFDTFSTFEGIFDEDTGLGYLAGIEEDHTENCVESHRYQVDDTSAPIATPTMSPTVGNSSSSNEAGGAVVVTANVATTSTGGGAGSGDKARSFSQESASSQNNAPNTGVIEKREHLYKILVIGELGTGKTSIIKRYVHQFFSQNYRATIGVDFALKVLNWDPHTIIRLQLWDIAGQERFGNMTRVYYKEAVGAFIVFDVTRSATLDAVVKWKQDLDSKVQLPDGSPIPCVLLANKCDQQKEGLINSPAKMDEYCKEKNFVGWFETSAKENINIEEAARFLVSKILQNDQKMRGNGTQDQTDGERFALNQSPETSKKSCSC